MNVKDLIAACSKSDSAALQALFQMDACLATGSRAPPSDTITLPDRVALSL
jgi:hypothetical protein